MSCYINDCMGMPLLLSIIIPVYNSELFLRDCVESLYQQNISEDLFEIILVNDGSTDRSYMLCQESLSRYTNIRLFSQKNQGQSVARNLGLENARGKYILFVDSDDRLPQNVIIPMLQEAEGYDIEILIGSVEVFNKKGEKSLNSDFQKYNQIVTGEYILLNGGITGSVWGRLFLRSFIENNHLRFLPGIKHEDVLFTIQSLVFAKRVVSLKLCSYVYAWNSGSTDRSLDGESKLNLLLSDIMIAYKIQVLAQQERLSHALRCFLRKKSNSIIVGNIVWILESSYRRKNYLYAYIAKAKDMGVFPIRGKTLSFKTMILVKCFNFLERIYASLY